MPRYIYTDRTKGPILYVTYASILSKQPTRPFNVREGVRVFECVADDILSADKQLLDATGIIAAKDIGICCSVEPN